MALSLKTAGTWAEYTADGTVAIPGTPASGNRMFLFAAWKDYSITATVSGWTAIGSEFADGTVSAGVNAGSIKVQAWYRDWQSGDTDPTIDWSSNPNIAGAVIQLWQKGGGDTWDTPLEVTAAWFQSSSNTLSAASTVNVPDNSVVMALLGFRDDSSTMTRGTDGIDTASEITWNGDYVESPETHLSTTTAGDGSYDLGHRFVTTGGTGVTLRVTATLSAAETGSVKWVIQGGAAAPTSTSSNQNSMLLGVS